MRNTILLVGCGNIGSRHLQALVKLPFKTDIKIVEPKKTAQTIAKQRLSEIHYIKKNFNIFWYNDISELDSASDLVILATTSENRIDLINKLLKLKNKRFLIEKIVCQSVSEYNLILQKLKKSKAMGWVNTNMRYSDSYKKIKTYFKNSNTIHVSLTTSANYGLGTNAIHYLDFFSWLINDYHITLDGSLLTNKLFPNKRSKDLVEFAGLLFGSNQNGSTVTINFIPNSNLPLILNIYGNNIKHLLVNESTEEVYNIIHKEPKFDFIFEHTSNLTTKIVVDIFRKNKCDLTTVEDSYYLHKELLTILSKHMEKLIRKPIKKCPIT